jgi:hypothetical protein
MKGFAIQNPVFGNSAPDIDVLTAAVVFSHEAKKSLTSGK